MALVLGTTYDNIWFNVVIDKIRDVIVTDRNYSNAYISPIYQDKGSYSVRIWGNSAETVQYVASEWNKRYELEIVLYEVSPSPNEIFYKTFYSDIERLYQVLFNNRVNSVTSDGNTYKYSDGQVGDITINDLTEAEEAVDGLHSATITFSCSVFRPD